jgi:hypothetical protein
MYLFPIPNHIQYYFCLHLQPPQPLSARELTAFPVRKHQRTMQRNGIAVSRDQVAVNMRLASKIDRLTWLLREAAVTMPAATVTQDMTWGRKKKKKKHVISSHSIIEPRTCKHPLPH